MKKKSKVFIGLSIAAVIIVVIMVGVHLITTQAEANHDKQIFKELQSIAENTTEESEVPETTSPVETEPETVEEQGRDTGGSGSGGYTESTRNVADIIALNNDCIGWLTIDGAYINYPIMHTPDEPEKYLYANFYQYRSSHGTPFMGSNCSLNSDNIVIYGHNMLDGTMFSNLSWYENENYCMNNSSIVFETQEWCRTYEVFAVATVDKNDEWYSSVRTNDPEIFKQRVERIMGIAHFTTGITPEFGDKMITLSTCSNHVRDGRLIVIGVWKNAE